jgi:hypothetical protein
MRAALDAALSEREWALMVERAFSLGGWRFYHPHDPRRSETILDYIAWRDRLIWVELKTQRGRLSRDRVIKGRYGHVHVVNGQFETVRSLKEAGQEVYVWRPADWDEVLAVLGVQDVSVSAPARSVPRPQR